MLELPVSREMRLTGFRAQKPSSMARWKMVVRSLVALSMVPGGWSGLDAVAVPILQVVASDGGDGQGGVFTEPSIEALERAAVVVVGLLGEGLGDALFLGLQPCLGVRRPCLGVGDEAVAGGALLLIFLVVGRVKSVRWIAACESAQTKPLSMFQEYNGVPPVPPVVLLLFRQLESAASVRFHSLRQILAARATCPAVATTGPTGTDAPAPRR